MSDRLAEFFRDREIFVTGGSGFIGKVFVEKVLRSFDVRRVYVLLREKKGQQPAKRLEALKNDKIFSVLRNEKPQELDKLVPLAGDISLLSLGLSPDSIALLQNVSIVFNSAATIRFDEPLATAILINVRGTREVLRIAEKLPKLQVFLHVSTLFSNCNRRFIDEKIYPAPADWRSCIKIAEHPDQDLIRVLTKKLTQGFPNSYTFTKLLSEHVVNDFQHTVPVAIVRPSIVLCALFDPVPGYTDNVAGSMSVAVAGGAGLLRNLLCDPDLSPNQVPVDVVTRIAILSIWKAASYEAKRLPFICNISGEMFPELSLRTQLVVLGDVWKDIPYGKMFWKPYIYPTSCETLYFVRFVFTQLLPAALVDAVLRLSGQKPVLVKFQRTILGAVKGFQFFLSSPIETGTANMKALMDASEEFPGFEARHDFHRDNAEYGKAVAWSCRRFILKEDDAELPKAKRLYKCLTVADAVLRGFLLVALVALCWNVLL